MNFSFTLFKTALLSRWRTGLLLLLLPLTAFGARALPVSYTHLTLPTIPLV